MRTNVTSNVVNMIGNYLLIQGHLGFPAMGIAGAALATVFGTIVACIMSICSLIPKDNFVSIPYIIKERVRITLEPAKNMAKIASSVFIEQVFMRTGFLLVSIMAARLGTSAYAAHQVAMNVMNLSFSFGDGMQVASVALCGRSLGEAPGSGGHVRDDLPEDRKHDLHRIVDPVPDVRKLVFPPVLC